MQFRLIFAAFFTLTLFNFSTLSYAKSDPARVVKLHTDLTETEVKKLSASLGTTRIPFFSSLQYARQWGDRLATWIEEQNLSRAPDRKLRLSDPNLRRSYPIDQPNIYSETTVANELANLRKSVAQEFLDIADGLPNVQTQLSDSEIIRQARLIYRVYETAVRILTLDPYRDYYIARANEDLRGYYFLKNSNWEQSGFPIPSDTVAYTRLRDALVSICRNNGLAKPECESQIPRNLNSASAESEYVKYIAGAVALWESFFKIPEYAKRKDIIWSGTSATLAFQDPNQPIIANYLKHNIQDEFRWGNWQFFLNIGNFPFAPYVRFVSGTTPHVDDLGGNEIVMDANESIEEFASKWTIRHEFGHILGLPDCYFEFFDESIQSYVNYQLDPTDLMCSRAGNMNERIYLELKKNYEK